MFARKATTIVVSELPYNAGPITTPFWCERETQITIRERLPAVCANDNEKAAVTMTMNEKDGTENVEGSKLTR